MRFGPVALLVVLSGTGCQPSPPAIHDATRPRLVSSSPASGAANVPVDTAIQFTFDEKVRATFSVDLRVDGSPVSVTSRLSEDAKSIVIDRPALASLPAAVTVTLSGVTDLTGNAADPQPSLAWTYPDWLPVGEQLTTSGALQLAAGPTAGLFAAWLSGTTVNVRRWNGASWDTLASPGSGSNFSLVVDPGGAPIVAIGGAAPLVRRYASGSWSVVGNALPSQATASSGTFLAYEGGALHVAFGNAYQAYQCTAANPSGGCTSSIPEILSRLCVYRLSGASWAARSCATHTVTFNLVGFAGEGASVVVATSGNVRRLLDATAGSTANNFITLGSPTLVHGLASYGGTPITLRASTVERWNSTSLSWTGWLSGSFSVHSLSAFEDAAPVVTTASTTGDTTTVKVLRWNPIASGWDQLGRDFVGTTAEARDRLAVTTPTGSAVYRAINGVVSRYNE